MDCVLLCYWRQTATPLLVAVIEALINHYHRVDNIMYLILSQLFIEDSHLL